MAARRSRPLLVAPLIPLWGVIAFWGTARLRGTEYFLSFLVLMILLFVGLLGYVANQTLRARRARSGR